MPAPRKGQVRWRNARAYARVRLSPTSRPSIALFAGASEQAAQERAKLLAEQAARLRAVDHPTIAHELLERLGVAGTAKDIKDILGVIAKVVAGELVRPLRREDSPTFEYVAKLWTSGELHRLHPDHVRSKKSRLDVSRLKRINKLIGPTPVAEIGLDHADRVMRSLPAKLGKATRRHYAQVIHKVLALCVFPLRLIAASPLPKGWLPAVGKPRQAVPLYPDDDRALLRYTPVPLCWRIFFGWQAREGMRESESGRLQWSDLDMVRGVVCLDKNKTDDARPPWPMFPGSLEAMKVWHELCGKPGPDAFVFVDEKGKPLITFDEHGDPVGHIARIFREYLKAALVGAGLDRAQLWETTPLRRPIRLHDLRALMVTTAFANGRSSEWIGDRTGHTTWAMLKRYRRSARSVAELGLGDLESLSLAVPELRTNGPRNGPKAENGGGGRGGNSSEVVQLAQVAQLVEQRIENPRVGGSIPSLGTASLRRAPRCRSPARASSTTG